MGREENVLIFQDTERLSKTNGKLNADLKASASGQKLILETDALEKPNLNIYDEPAKVIVSKKRTFEAAKAYRDNKCLCFKSGRRCCKRFNSPGGVSVQVFISLFLSEFT